jgi:hypothetical protein
LFPLDSKTPTALVRRTANNSSLACARATPTVRLHAAASTVVYVPVPSLHKPAMAVVVTVTLNPTILLPRLSLANHRLPITPLRPHHHLPPLHRRLPPEPNSSLALATATLIARTAAVVSTRASVPVLSSLKNVMADAVMVMLSPMTLLPRS